MPIVRYRAVVSGRVQGVWFRESCRREASRLGVAGWVRNRNDGQVELEVEGDGSAAAELVSWCRMGPPSADVTGVEVTERALEGTRGFRIVP